MDWTFPNEGPVTAHLELAAGLVEVSLDATDEILVRLEPLHGGDDRAEAQAAAAEVAFSGSVLSVRVPKRKMRESDLRLRVSIPPGSSLRSSTASADVRVRGAAAGIDVQTASGDLAVADPCDRLKVATASGDILCASVAGEADIRTASGDVSVESIGGEISIRTASGDVGLASVSRSARVRTASGDVRIGAASSGHISVNTVSGDVTLGVASGVGAWLDLSTVSGETSCTLPSEPQGENSAELRISCQTVSGDILVRESNGATL